MILLFECNTVSTKILRFHESLQEGLDLHVPHGGRAAITEPYSGPAGSLNVCWFSLVYLVYFSFIAQVTKHTCWLKRT